LGNEYPLNWVGWLDVDHSGTGRNVAWVALNTRSRTRAWFPRSVGYALSITTKSKNVVLLVSIVELATRFVNHVHGLSRNHINQRHSSLEQRTFEMILSSPVLRAGKNLQVCWFFPPQCSAPARTFRFVGLFLLIEFLACRRRISSKSHPTRTQSVHCLSSLFELSNDQFLPHAPAPKKATLCRWHTREVVHRSADW
jgi:hypothetical protein